MTLAGRAADYCEAVCGVRPDVMVSSALNLTTVVLSVPGRADLVILAAGSDREEAVLRELEANAPDMREKWA